MSNNGHDMDYDNPEANKDFEPPRFKDEYYCPMGCEGDKTYPEPGNCPVCNMTLMPVKERK